ncbi:MAG: PEP/pyruvate-binding domain-containing protein [Planctomycetota bacterium]|nr:PEP/pyruvate-binding domain-containing protein [Planctomycetota bacterium]
MTTTEGPIDQILQTLRERAKELTCLYEVDEILSRQAGPSPEVYQRIVEAIPPGWQYSEICRCRIVMDGQTFEPENFQESPWCMSAEIRTEGEPVGEIAVYYTEEKPKADEGPFLKEERKLINTIAERISLFLMQQRLRSAHQSWKSAVRSISARETQPWAVLLEFLRRTDLKLLGRITRKMINHLCWNGVREAEALLHESLLEEDDRGEAAADDENRPMVRRRVEEGAGLTERTFEVAARHLSEAEVVACMQRWINEEKSTYLIKSLENPGTGLAEMAEAVDRYQAAAIDESELPLAVQTSLKVALLRRYFVDQLTYIKVAKGFVRIEDFYDLIQHLIHPARSQGKLGGKGAGLFLATQILRKSPEYAELFRNLKIPRTWYLASDTLLEFIHYNNLEEVYNRKYMEVERLRQDYPHIIQVFKNSPFPPEIVKGLAVALDDFEDRPLIVRSSSLLEDQVGSAFSGKYKSLFVANQGTKEQRLAALQDAIAEVYASVFSPDPIEYRAERGLLDFREEMGILIQEVVGRRIGKYFMPAFAGVAFSNNEFRWSARIKQQDGLVRMVPGLGTRAVDRLADDYPVLVSPGQPNLRVNVTPDEIVRYSPAKMDVINLEHNVFETVDVRELLRECGDDYPAVRKMISMVDHNQIRKPSALEPDWESDDFVVTFEGLIEDGLFVNQLKTMLTLLSDKLGTPVDLEFAHDGDDFYLVQCRSQSYAKEHAPAPIPRDIPRDRLLFTANRYVSNGRIPDITHIVYVDPERYASLGDLQEMKDVGRAVGRLNMLLPKRQFVLMGPGRWGSRGDIKLGVSVTYSEINNTAVLLEIARQKGNYVPELSFGTHFFQDLVEAEIRYLPLYPDDPDAVFHELFFRRSGNILPDLLPEFAHLSDVIRVIDVPRETDGRVLRMLMNADLDEAVGMLAPPGTEAGPVDEAKWIVDATPENHWRWRLRMAERIASHVDAQRFGIKAMYVFGSTKNATAGPGSDVDLIVHDHGDLRQRRQFSTWLEGWSLTLAEINYLRTGYSSDGLLDVHFVTDEDIANRTSYASKIGAVTDAARPLRLGNNQKQHEKAES